MVYITVLILLLLLSIRYDINRKKEGRDQWYRTMLIIFILIAGLRFRVTGDTIAYLYSFYHAYPEFGHLDFARIDSFPHEPLWVIVNSIVKSLGGKFFIVQIIQASIVNIIIFNFFKKHSSHTFLCIFFYYILAYHYFSMMIMRNAIAIAICLLANDLVLKRKWKKAYLLYFVAVMFHYSSALIMLITPFILFLRLNKVGVFLLFSTLIVGSVLQSYLSDIFSMIDFSARVSNRLDAYMDVDAFSTEEADFKYYIFKIVVPIIYIMSSLNYVKKHNSKSNLLKLEPFVMIGLLILVLQVNIALIHRFSRAYEVYFILFYVQFFMAVFKAKPKKVMSDAASFARTLFVFSPLLLYAINSSVLSPRYSAYNTIFERKIDIELENKYIISRGTSHIPNKNEY